MNKHRTYIWAITIHCCIEIERQWGTSSTILREWFIGWLGHLLMLITISYLASITEISLSRGLPPLGLTVNATQVPAPSLKAERKAASGDAERFIWKNWNKADSEGRAHAYSSEAWMRSSNMVKGWDEWPVGSFWKPFELGLSHNVSCYNSAQNLCQRWRHFEMKSIHRISHVPHQRPWQYSVLQCLFFLKWKDELGVGMNAVWGGKSGNDM